MPTYVYDCGACKRATEIFHSMSDAPKRKCPKCGKSKLVRRIGTGAGILFKGSGFYQTDYRSDAYKKSEAAEKTGSSTPDKPDASKTDATKSDAKPSADTKSADVAKPESDGKAAPHAKKSSAKRGKH
jgi:putative FmdB family regulatory protein